MAIDYEEALDYSSRWIGLIHKKGFPTVEEAHHIIDESKNNFAELLKSESFFILSLSISRAFLNLSEFRVQLDGTIADILWASFSMGNIFMY